MNIASRKVFVTTFAGIFLFCGITVGHVHAAADLTGTITKVTLKEKSDGNKLTVKLTISNIGTDTATGPFFVQLWLSEDARLSIDDEALDFFTIKKIKAGKAKTRKFKVRGLDDVAGKGVIVSLDGGGAVAESNELNNILMQQIVSEPREEDTPASNNGDEDMDDGNGGGGTQEVIGKCTTPTQVMCWEWGDAATFEQRIRANCTASLEACNADVAVALTERTACMQADEAGPATDLATQFDTEHCWNSRQYRAFVSIPPDRPSFPPGDQAEANRLISVGWNQPTSIATTYIKTADLPETSLATVRAGISAAEAYLGTYGPFRVYVIGTDVAATEPLVQDFCTWAHNPDQFNRCLMDQGQGIREIAQFKGGNAFAQHSRNLASPNQSFVIGNPELGQGSKVAAHEYIHIYQNAHLLIDRTTGDYDNGLPGWLEEGSAEFLALYLADQQGWEFAGANPFSSRMQEALDVALALRSLIPGLRIQDIETSKLSKRVSALCGLCMGTLQSETGQWATQWLINKTSLDTFYLSFLPDNATLGWVASFTKHFGLTPDAFYAEFDNFMNLSREAQLAILLTP